MLNLETPSEDFLQAICFDYEEAARFVLDWYEENSQAAINYLAVFLSLAYDKLDMQDCYLGRRFHTYPTFLPSVALAAFECFCELLFECPTYVSSVLASSEASEKVRLLSPLANRFICTQSLLRERTWSPTKYAFANPHPIPYDAYVEYEKRCEIAREEASKREEEQRKIVDEKRRIRKERKRRENALKIAQRRKESKKRKVYRDYFSKLVLSEQVDELIRRRDIHVKVFPFDPSLIDQSIKSKLSEEQKAKLLERVSTRWEEPWKKLADQLRSDEPGQKGI